MKMTPAADPTPIPAAAPAVIVEWPDEPVSEESDDLVLPGSDESVAVYPKCQQAKYCQSWGKDRSLTGVAKATPNANKCRLVR
jgi:hypothetical protein